MNMRMMKSSTHWIILLLHCIVVVLAAYATHHVNCLNVWHCRGSYSFWMTTASHSYQVITYLRWLTPIVFVACYFGRKAINLRTALVVAFISVVIFLTTLPIYSALIEYWERGWGTAM